MVTMVTMEWRSSLKNFTITINGSLWDQLLATKVFQWFFPILRTNGSQWLQTEICDKLRVNKDVKKLKCELSIYFSQMFYIFSQSHIFFTRTCAVSICLFDISFSQT